MKASVWTTFLLIFSLHAVGNGLTIQNLTRDSLAQTVTFDISWNNSWRLASSTAPGNWDAAWVFVKFQECTSGITTAWEHGILNGSLAAHNFGTLEPVLSDGTAIGLDADLRGVMLRRTTDGLYPSEPVSTITLSVPNMNTTTAYNVRVVGIEMVFVTEGAYDLGAVTYSNAFSSTTSPTNALPASVASENAQTLTSHASGTNGSVALPADFPKGYGAFHIMKYEISQGQYATFLNTLSIATQLNRYPGNYNTYRNTLNGGSNNALAPYQADRPDRAQNYLSWTDVSAYLDWAALRPMTEMEYEKACRGYDPSFADELAWGSDIPLNLSTVTSPEDGSEIPGNLPSNIRSGNTLLAGGDGGYGPVRVGIFALPTNTTRGQSGAGYFGATELSGNVWEPCIQVGTETSTTGTYAFDHAEGDGTLDTNGAANETNWPGEGSNAIIRRGGGWNSSATLIRTSDRSQLNWSGARDRATGGRGVRD
ncbi:MAG: SUMF1/EgtB/PvdO family nonheme iron enzyme [Bacteroidota bacterium]